MTGSDGTSGFKLYEPLNTLKPFGTDIWIADGSLIRMAFPAGLSVPFSTRMVVVRLPSGKLWVWSPIAPDQGLRQELDRLGPVAHLVSPNAIHYAHIPAWAELYPAARCWASPGVEKRAASQRIDVAFDAGLEDAGASDFEEAIDIAIMRGSRAFDEVIFFHRASRTLILADLIENYERHRVPARWRWLMRLAGMLHPDGKTPLDYRLTFLGSRRRARKVLETVLAWEPDSIIIAHGKCYQGNADEELRRAFRWLL